MPKKPTEVQEYFFDAIIKLSAKGVSRSQVSSKLDISYPYAAQLIGFLLDEKKLAVGWEEGREYFYIGYKPPKNKSPEVILTPVPEPEAAKGFMLGGRQVILEDDDEVVNTPKVVSKEPSVSVPAPIPTPVAADEDDIELALLESKVVALRAELLATRAALTKVYMKYLEGAAK